MSRGLTYKKGIVNRKSERYFRTNKVNSSIKDFVEDPITIYASKHWAVGVITNENPSKYDEQMVKDIYNNEIKQGLPSRIKLLNYSGYLDNYLWHHYDDSVCIEHTLSIIFLINEKSSDFVNNIFQPLTRAWDETKFQSFFTKTIEISSIENLHEEQLGVQYIQFLINLYQSLDNATIRKNGLRYLFLHIWEKLSPSRLETELSQYPQLKKHWQSIQTKKEQKMLAEAAELDSKKKRKRNEPVKQATAKSKKQKTTEIQSPSTETSTIQPTQDPNYEATWIPTLIENYLKIISSESVTANSITLTYVEKFSELLADLLSQLPTRRFLNTYLDDINFIPKVKRCNLYKLGQFKLFKQLINLIDSYTKFPFHDHTGKALSTTDVMALHHSRVSKLQHIIYTDYYDVLKDLVFSSIGQLSKYETIRKYFIKLNIEQISDIAIKLGKLTNSNIEIDKQLLIKSVEDIDDDENDEIFEYIFNVLTDYLIPRSNQLDEINLLPLYPTEELLWDESNLYNDDNKFTIQSLALPKLNLQFLTNYDYLLRNFQLYRVESSYQIREDLVDSIKRMGPNQNDKGETIFNGWSRMALPIESLSIDEVASPKLGELVPARVHAVVNIDLIKLKGDIRVEWESFREHDIVFLVCIEKPISTVNVINASSENDSTKIQKDAFVNDISTEFAKTYGVKYIRGGEVFEYRDEDDVVLNDYSRPDERANGRSGSKRKLRIKLDPAQYYLDLKNGKDCYESLNLIIRRDPKENNFKAILETIRDIMNDESKGQSIPTWLQDVFLGYGNPNAANYRNLPKSLTNSSSDFDEIHDYCDTFLDALHIAESFPGIEKFLFGNLNLINGQYEEGPIQSAESDNIYENYAPPYKVYIKREPNNKDIIKVLHYDRPNRGPYPDDKPQFNKVRFTSHQIEAIRSGMNPGLTVIVGPPGTGKTDTAVQIISNLYHNFPTQKIVIVTHSNAALNDLFEKIMERDIDPRHLLRLGSGERDLRELLAVSGAKGSGRGKGEEFTKQGRVNWSLGRRIQLLNQVQHLGQTIGAIGDVGSTCETAEYFYNDQIRSKINAFKEIVCKYKDSKENANLSTLFPFNKYFEDVPEKLFTGDFDKDFENAEGCINHIEKMFDELKDLRAFELLRTQVHRSDYLLIKQARIVAMTCTHAAITRKRLLELDFKYDSLIMEEAAQVLEIETLIPMLLQKSNTVEGCRLQRLVLIGDHHQLPPIIQHASLKKYSKLDQSLFSRLIRLGVPYVILNKQGRCRADIALLFSWRYDTDELYPDYGLYDLPNVNEDPIFKKANQGFVHTFQFINVNEFKGVGEFSPTPYYYQNLGEAEYVVAVYQYMRLIGYPANKISILTTYNGQKNLINDILTQRCKNTKLFGFPRDVTTVDKFQGQQNDYILLSLVRTESIGHIRDVRRLVVALSRARLGLYIFGKQSLFENCYELNPTFQQLLHRPSKLELFLNENYNSDRGLHYDEENYQKTTIEDVTAMGVLVYQMAQNKINS